MSVSMTGNALFLFPNVHKVMKADRICKSKGIATRVIPVPEDISSECGMCLLVSDSNLEICTKVLSQAEISFELHKR